MFRVDVNANAPSTCFFLSESCLSTSDLKALNYVERKTYFFFFFVVSMSTNQKVQKYFEKKIILSLEKENKYEMGWSN